MRSLKIFTKLFFSHTTIGLFSVLLLSFIFFTILKTSLIQRTIDQLTSINILKKNQIENYFYRTKQNLLFLTNQKEFISSYKEFPSDVPSSYTGEFQREIYGLEKLYEFDNISVFNKDLKKIFATSSDTSYLSIFQNLNYIDTSAYPANTNFKIVDASIYNPSKEPLILYIIPLVEKERGIGFLVIKENFQKLQKILYERTGMGSTGESYLVAQDSLMRSASRFFPEKAPLSIKVNTEATTNAFKGITEDHLLEDYRGEKVVSIYRKLDVPDLPWALISEIDFNEAIKPINQLKNYLILITLVMILIILLITYFISNAISKPILYLKDILVNLSKGILPQGSIQGRYDDEIGQITNATNQLVEGLKRTTEFAHEIGAGNFKASFTSLSDKDTLGIALISMREKLKSLNEREVRLVREKAAALIEGQENERKRIISELHDGVGQLLTVIKLRFQMMEGQDEIKEEIKSLINETITEVRRISYNVMPSALVDFGLEAALRGLCENIKKHSGLSIDFTYVKEEEAPLNFEISIAVFRIIQEGLNNILKHAKATEAKIYVVENEDQIYFVLKDNGIGFHKESAVRKGGFGLSGMKERAKLLHGEVEIQSGPGNGTVIEVHIPVNRENDE